MIETLSAASVQPFTLALFLLVGLTLLELALLLVGLSSDLGLETPDLPDADAPLPELPPLSPEILAEIPALAPAAASGGLAAELAAQDGLATELVPQSGLAVSLRFIGLGEAPAMIWLAALAGGFAAYGFALQGLASALLGQPLSALLASLLVALPALLTARSVARLLGRLLPSVESYGTSSFHGRRGTITVGIAKSGYPAEVRYLDLHGTSHQLMAEPLDPKDAIPAGTPVLILRDRAGKPRLVRLG